VPVVIPAAAVIVTTVVDAVAVPVAIVIRQRGPYHHAGGKRHRGSSRCSILMHHDDIRVIVGNVDGGGCGLNHDDLLFDDDHLFLVGGKVPSGIGQISDALDRGHHVFELGTDRLAESNHPLEIGLHFVQHFWELNEDLDARMPRLVIGCVNLTSALFQVAGRFNHIHGCGRGGQNVGDQRIRVQRNGCDELVELIG